MDLNGTSAIVTGGASGLGLATSRLLAERGVRVVVADLQADKGEPLAKEIGGLFVQTDVTNPEQVIAAVDAAVEMAPLKSLVNCAGIGWATRTIGRDGDYASAHDLDLYRRVIEINLIGTFNCIRLAATKMSLNEPDVDGARGAIVNTSSVAAEDGQIGQAAYSSSKGGVVGMTLPVARDLAVVGIRVNTILPGLIDTPIYGEGEGAETFKGKLSQDVLFPHRLGYATEFATLGARAAVQLVHQRRVDPHRRRHPDAAQIVRARQRRRGVRNGGGTVMIDPELAAMIDLLPKMDLADPVAARQAFEEILVAIRFDIPGIETLDIEDRMVPGFEGDPDVPVRVYRPEGATAATRVPGVVMIHGGGFVIGSVEAEHAGAALMAMDTGAVVVSVDYRLAPEHPYPAGLHDCYAALTYLHAEADALGVDPGAGGAGRRQRRRRAGGGHGPAGPRPGRTRGLLPAAADPRARRPAADRLHADLRGLAHVEPAAGRAELAGVSRSALRRGRRAGLRRAGPGGRPVRAAAGLHLDGRERPAARRGHHLCPAPAAGGCLGGAAPVPRHLPRLGAGDDGGRLQARPARVGAGAAPGARGRAGLSRMCCAVRSVCVRAQLEPLRTSTPTAAAMASGDADHSEQLARRTSG